KVEQAPLGARRRGAGSYLFNPMFQAVLRRMCCLSQSQYSHFPAAITYPHKQALATACARTRSPKLLVRIIHTLNTIPAARPTSQYGPCSLANSNATTQTEDAE